MAGLVGEYECKLDAKGRFLFPSGLKKQLDPSANEHFMVNKGFENCLTLYPMNEWDKVSARLSKLNLFREKEVGLKIPLVVRLQGTNVDKGKKMLEESGLELGRLQVSP